MDHPSRSAIAIGVGVVGAGLVAAIPAQEFGPRIVAPAVALTSTDNPDIVIDWVRHGETEPPGSVIQVASQGLPGFPLSTVGQEQAAATGQQLMSEFGPHVAGIFGGYEQRMIETAQPYLDDAGLNDQAFHPLYGLNEIGGGIYADAVPGSLGAYLSDTIALWAFGALLFPRPGSNDYTGVVFDDNVNNAVATAYREALANPVVSANGHITELFFSGDGTITLWTALNVKNPDLAILLPLVINALSTGNISATAGQTIVEGNPTDGWTLLSFSGHDFPQDPGLLTNLFVDVRNLIEAPQFAVSHLLQVAVNGVSVTIGGDSVGAEPTSIESAFESAVYETTTAIGQFPGAIGDSITTAVDTFGTGLASGESFGDLFDSVIVGLPG